MMTATTKTFNIAGTHIGNVIIPDEALRARFRRRMDALGISPNSFGIVTATAAYSPEGAAWVDALNGYLDGKLRFRPLMIPDRFTEQSSQGDMYAEAGLDRAGIVAAAFDQPTGPSMGTARPMVRRFWFE